MAGNQPAEGSFDPRSWAGARPADATGDAGATGSETAAVAVTATPSFDPTTWQSGEPLSSAAATETAKQSKRGAMAIGGGATLVLLTALALLINRPSEPADSSQPAVKAGASGHAQSSMRSLTLAGVNGIERSLIDLGIADATARAASRIVAARLSEASGEIRLVIEFEPAGTAMTLIGMEVTRADGSGIQMLRNGARFTVTDLAANLQTEIRSIAGEMDSESFYSSAVKAGLVDVLIAEFAAAFSFDLDFQRDVNPGDVFEAVYEQSVNDAGQPVGTPKLLFVSIRTETKSLRLYRYAAPGEEAGWFDGIGSSNQRSLMRTPVDGARVSSRFGYRTHPIQGYQKLHRGIDFAAPTGTPIYAAGDAVVIWAQPRGGAGNAVRLQHDNGWFTHYFHLSAFAEGLAAGTRVRQGQEIGRVGSTGASTGPHLHYEIWIDGDPVDPQTVDTGTAKTLEPAALAAFIAERDRIDGARAGRR